MRTGIDQTIALKKKKKLTTEYLHKHGWDSSGYVAGFEGSDICQKAVKIIGFEIHFEYGFSPVQDSNFNLIPPAHR